MILARVTGRITSTVHHPDMEGRTLLVLDGLEPGVGRGGAGVGDVSASRHHKSRNCGNKLRRTPAPRVWIFSHRNSPPTYDFAGAGPG